MTDARFFNSEDGTEMVEIRNAADKNTVIKPAEQAHRDSYPKAYAQHAGRHHIGNSSGHNASMQTTVLPQEPEKANNPANDQAADPRMTGEDQADRKTRENDNPR